MYREHAKRTGIDWQRRDYDPDDFDSGTPVNKALSAANTSDGHRLPCARAQGRRPAETHRHADRIRSS
jgi:hypothetical protein